ncbi:hypothetical protein H4S07_006156 [Coemansia furcata]|uniref:Uncharacterized protein n=1 Tax=Coemansia furcata TaxID=417177 RepID=A0ACC1KWK1_9FUNG|nr:hypothetical protein H4S07_006156 [Coemansia furcata]
MPWLQQHSLPPPPAALLRNLSGGPESRTAAYLRTLGHVIDPLTNPAQHFEAYRHMRARKLAKYQLPAEPTSPQPLTGDGNGIDCEPLVPSSKIDTPRARQSQGPTSLHLSTCEDLRWDALSEYLRQQLSIDNDYLGKEAQAARGHTAHPFADATMACLSPQSDSNNNTAVFVSDFGVSPLKSEGSNHEWDGSPEYAEGDPVDDMRPKCYSMSNVFSISNANSNRNVYPNAVPASPASRVAPPSQSIDARRFHDAIWHFTLSLYHIYEEYYFYSKYKDEMTPESTQADIRHPSPAMDSNYSQYGAMPIPSQQHPQNYYIEQGPAAMSVDTDTDLDTSNSSGQYHFSNSPQQYSKWLTEELKLHIRSVVRNPGSIHAMAAQPPMATGLNLCVEEMVHVNLVISLAQRQAEIIHGIRAIREYEGNPTRQ